MARMALRSVAERYAVSALVMGGLTWMVADCSAATFEDVTTTAGITHLQHRPANPALGFMQVGMSGGAAAVDYDNDGWIDLYFTLLDRPDILYRNLGNGTFADVTSTAFGPAHLATVHTNGSAWADIDNDGDQDLYVTSLKSKRYHLFINDGKGSFTEEAVARGAAIEGIDEHFGFSASFGDYDNDGYLDLHVNEWRTSAQNPFRKTPNTRLLRNRGGAAPGHFEDVTVPAGVVMNHQRTGGFSGESLAFSSRFVDLDFDGWPELLAVSDGGTSRLFWNNRDGTFKDGTSSSQVGTDQFGMGMAVGDYDRDGDFDWFVTSIHGSLEGDGNRLYRYEGGRRFSDATSFAGVRRGGWGWGANFLDYDHDGLLDLMMVNGMRGFADDPTMLWSNSGLGYFTHENGPGSGITDDQIATGTLSLDYDNDGDLDLLILNNGAKPILYRNEGHPHNKWLKIAMIGTRSNRDGIGAIVRLRVHQNDRPLLRFVDGGTNFLGQNERTLHFGLGDAVGTIHEIEITWPSGRIQRLHDLAPNQLLTITEPAPIPLVLAHLQLSPRGRAEGTWVCHFGARCVLEISDDLAVWRKATVLEAQGSTVTWTDPENSPPAQRFYRAWR
ncbi:MAG: CRTAC1 family protein [Roseibacillus sp.]